MRAERARRHLSEFIKQGWPVIEPATSYLHNWHIDAISEYLEAVTLGQITRLIINVPPRYMKSISVTVMWPCWEWIQQPWTRWITASYSQSLSTKHSVDRRTLIRSDWYQDRWGHVYRLKDDHDLKTEYENTKRGVMFATSVGGTATGKGGNRIIVDDPHNPMEAASDVQRKAAIDFFDQSLTTRLNNKKRDAIVVIMQRLHQKDLTGHLLEKGGWEHLKLPAEARERTVVHFPISGREIVREPGDILWPEREGSAELAQMRRNLGGYGYAGQYDQEPAPAGGGKFRREWFEIVDAAPADCRVVRFWDLAATEAKPGKDPDWTRGAKVGLKDGIYYIMDMRGLRDTPKRVEDLIKQTAILDGRLVEIYMEQEPGSSGKNTIDHYARRILVGYAFRGVQSTGSKEMRANPVSAAAEAGNVKLVRGPWIHDFLDEIELFPYGSHDDQVDAVSGAFERLAFGPRPEVRVIDHAPDELDDEDD